MNQCVNRKETIQERDPKAFLEQVNTQLEIIKEGYADPLDGVLTYNKKGVCTSFFDGEKEITTEDIQNKESGITDKLNELEYIKNTIEQSNLSPNFKTIYIKSVEGITNKFKMFKAALWIEATKSGYDLDERIRYEKSIEISTLQELIYGAKVSETKEERDVVINRLHQNFDKNNNKLTDEERQIYQNFLKKMDEKYTYTSVDADDGNIEKKEVSASIKSHKNDKVISKEKLKEYTNKILNIYKEYFIQNNIDLQGREADFNSEKKNLSVSAKEELSIPEDYENISKEKLTKTVIGHEIEQHLFGWNNNNRLLGKGFMGNGYDLISEGVAKINEAIASGEVSSLEDLENLKEKPGLGMIGIFICENYDYKESVELLRIYHKLGKRKEESECLKKATDMVKRRKRFFDYNQPGSSVKDGLYERGKNEIINRLTENHDLQDAVQKYKDMSFGKLGKEELALVPELKKELGINDNQILYTLMISRILNDKLTKGIGSAKEYTNPLNMKTIDVSTKRQLINILNDIKSLDSN